MSKREAPCPTCEYDACINCCAGKCLALSTNKFEDKKGRKRVCPFFKQK